MAGLFYDPQVHNVGGAISRGIGEGMNLGLTNINLRRQRRQDVIAEEKLVMERKANELQEKQSGLALKASEMAMAEAEKWEATRGEIGQLHASYVAKLNAAKTPEERATIIGQENKDVVSKLRDKGYYDKAYEMEDKVLTTAKGMSKEWGPGAAKRFLDASPLADIFKDITFPVQDLDKSITSYESFRSGKKAAGWSEDKIATEWERQLSGLRENERKAGRAKGEKDDASTGKKKMTPAALEAAYNNLKKDLTGEGGLPLPGKEKLYANIAAYRLADLDRISKGFEPVNLSNVARALTGAGRAGTAGPPVRDLTKPTAKKTAEPAGSGVIVNGKAYQKILRDTAGNEYGVKTDGTKELVKSAPKNVAQPAPSQPGPSALMTENIRRAERDRSKRKAAAAAAWQPIADKFSMPPRDPYIFR